MGNPKRDEDGWAHNPGDVPDDLPPGPFMIQSMPAAPPRPVIRPASKLARGVAPATGGDSE